MADKNMMSVPMSVPMSVTKGSAIGTPYAPTNTGFQMFDFRNMSVPQTTTKTVSNEEILNRLIWPSTANKMKQATAQPLNLAQERPKQKYSRDIKMRIWKDAWGDESNFDENDFNRSVADAIYLKNSALSKIKKKEPVIQNIADTIIPKAQAQESALTEEEIQQLINEWATEEEVLKVDSIKRNQMMIEARQAQPQEIEQTEQWWLLYNIGEQLVTWGERIGEAIKGYQEWSYTAPEAIARWTAGATQAVFSPVTGTVQTGVEKFVPESFKQEIANIANPTITDVQNWYNSQSPQQKRNLDNIGIGVELLANIAGVKGGKAIAPKAWEIAQKWAKWVVKVVKAPITGTKQVVTRTIPKKVVSNDLWFTPTERAKIEKITGKDEATYVLEKNLAGKGKEEMAEHFMNQSNDMYNGITEKLANTNTIVKSKTAKEALQDIVDQLESKPKIKRAYQADIDAAKAMMEKWEYTLSDLNNIRRAYDKVNTGMYTAQGQVRSGIENEIDVRVRNALSEQLQKEAEKAGIDVKEMNKELRAGLVMKDALLRRLSQEERNNFIGLQDLGVSAILSGGNPITAAATIAAKKYWEQIAPWIAQKLYKLNKKPHEARSVNRGNTISPSNKSNGLGLTSVTGSNNSVSKVKK